MKVLALDQSWTCGWAIGSTDGSRPTWGVLKLPRGTDETPAFLALHAFVTATIGEQGVGAVFFEATFLAGHSNMQTEFGKIGLAAVIMLAAGQQKVKAQQIPIQSWRSQFLGRSKPPPGLIEQHVRTSWFKDAAIKSCALRGWLVDDHNAAEALGILNYGLCTVSPEYAARDAPIFRRAQTKQEVWVR